MSSIHPLCGPFTPSFIADVAISGNYAYLADGCFGLLVIDLSNPSSPSIVRGVDIVGGVAHIGVSGNYAYLADEVGPFFWVFTLTNPVNPVVVGRTVLNDFGAGNMTVSGSAAAFAFGNAGFEVIDASDPSNPVGRMFTNNTFYVYGAALSGSYVYLAEGLYGVEVIDLQTLADPKRVGANAAFDGARTIVIQNDQIFIGGPNSLNILSLFKPLRFSTISNSGQVGFHCYLEGGIG